MGEVLYVLESTAANRSVTLGNIKLREESQYMSSKILFSKKFYAGGKEHVNNLWEKALHQYMKMQKKGSRGERDAQIWQGTENVATVGGLERSCDEILVEPFSKIQKTKLMYC